MGKKRKPNAAPDRKKLNAERADRDRDNVGDYLAKRRESPASVARRRAAGIRPLEQYTADRRARAEKCNTERADALAEFVRAQGGRPVGRVDAAAALSLTPDDITLVARHARERGLIRNDGRKTRGYLPAA